MSQSDFLIAGRRLVRQPGFAIVAVITIALGIAANTTIFSIVNGVMLKPLPFPSSERLVGLFQVWEGQNDAFAPPNLLDVETATTTMSGVAASSGLAKTLTGRGDDAVRLTGASVSAHFFDVLATPPQLGRWLRRDDNEPGHTNVAVLGYAAWKTFFAGDPNIVGRAITLDMTSVQVVGVMPEGFAWPLQSEFWMPAKYDDSYKTQQRGAWFLSAFGRMKPGVSAAQTEIEMAAIAKRLESAYPAENARVGMAARPLLASIVGDRRQALLLMLGAVGVVLLIACVNVANLLLARGAARTTEMAVRAALGASRARLAGQLLKESLVLAAAGGAAGLGLAAIGMRTLIQLRPAGIPRLETISIDTPVMLFTIGITLLTGLMFGVVPAIQNSGIAVANTMRDGGRTGTAGRERRRFRSALVIAEMALATCLLVGAGLLIRSFANLLTVDPGFSTRNAAVFNVGLPVTSYADDAARWAFYQRVKERLSGLPGVDAVGAAISVPPSAMAFNLVFSVAGRPPLALNDQPFAEIRVADEHYFGVMGIPVIRGRAFTNEDRPGSRPVALVTETTARKFFAGEDPIGKHITIGWGRLGRSGVEGDIVGIIGDVKSFGLEKDVPPQIYVPLAQVPSPNMSFVMRVPAGDAAAAALLPAVRASMRELDANLPLNRLETLESHIRVSVAERRFYMVLLAVFAGLALLLAAIGIFGVLSYLVVQRTREFAIRAALGAGQRGVMVMVARQAMTLAVAGVAIGLAGSLALSAVMARMVFKLSPTDPATLALVGVVLLTVALVAALIPARRAMRIDPVVALRADQ